MINVCPLLTGVLKYSVPYLHLLSSPVHHSVEFRQRVNQVQQKHAMTSSLKEKKKREKKSKRNYLLQLSLDFV